MHYHIDNGQLKVSVSPVGAQLMSIQSRDGTEYLWQGDPAYWADRAPNIFPYVARLTEGRYTYQGRTYEMPIHGFAPTADFTVTDSGADFITFTLDTTPALYAMYPFRFRFSI